MSYKDTDLPTGIHTRINDTIRISSVWRTYGNENFLSRGWETFLWENEKIVDDFQVLHTADDVVELHLNIVNRFRKDQTT